MSPPDGGGPSQSAMPQEALSQWVAKAMPREALSRRPHRTKENPRPPGRPDTTLAGGAVGMSPPDGGPDRVVPPAQGEPGLRAEATPFAPVGGSSSPSCTPLLFNSLHSPGPVEPCVWHRPGANYCPNFQPGGREENQEEVRQRGNAFAILGEPDEPAALAPYPTGQGANIALPPEPSKPGTPAEAALLRRPAKREGNTETEEPTHTEAGHGGEPRGAPTEDTTTAHGRRR